jgi:cyclopropane fatty-acyl-phospholipid synthase-like methyltransferase
MLKRGREHLQREGPRETIKTAIRYVSAYPVLSYIPFLLYLDRPSEPYVHEVKLYNKQFWLDRYSELINFYDYSHSVFGWYYLKHGAPNSRYFKKHGQRLERKYFFPPETSPSPEQLLEGYQNIHFYVSNRLLLGYHRYDIAQRCRDLIQEDDLSNTSVLDYGCGVTDPGVYLGQSGANVTIVDLDTRYFNLAIWRLEQRGIDHEAIRAEQTERPVDISEKFDCIIMSEFLEHVRNPRPFLELAVEQLVDDGIFYDPVGREYTHTVSTQHLKEAKTVVESEEYQRFHEGHFEHIGGNFWRKT